MAVKVYVIRDREAIGHIENGDVEGFKEYLGEIQFPDFGEPESFEFEDEALAFCSGLGYGVNESGLTEIYPLRSSEEADREFIEAITNFTL